jgi:hypothetical protein
MSLTFVETKTQTLILKLRVMKKIIGIFTMVCLFFFAGCSPEAFSDDQYEGETPEEIFGTGGENRAHRATNTPPDDSDL